MLTQIALFKGDYILDRNCQKCEIYFYVDFENLVCI